MDSDKKEKEKWFPGKYLAKHRRRSVETTSVPRSGSDDGGEVLRRGIVSAPNSFKDSTVEMNNRDIDSFVLSNFDPIGSLKVKVVEVKYLRLNSAKLTIQVDRVLSQHSLDGPNKSFERGFDLTEVASDIKIMIHGRSDNGEILCGVILIPVTSLLNFSGKPNSPKEQWRQLFPICPSRISDGKSLKFISGYSDLPGYALNRREPLGFVCVRVDLELFEHPLSAYLVKGNYSWKRLAASLPWFDLVSVLIEYQLLFYLLRTLLIYIFQLLPLGDSRFTSFTSCVDQQQRRVVCDDQPGHQPHLVSLQASP